MAKVYPPLPNNLRSELDAIEPSVDGDLKYYPCKVMLDDGRPVDGVYVVDFKSYIKVWGIRPEEDHGKSSIDLDRVVGLTESPNRLPARFASELYQAGESGMGYHVFGVRFKDGTRLTFLSGCAVDFIRYPEGKWPADLAGIEHDGLDEKPIRTPKYF